MLSRSSLSPPSQPALAFIAFTSPPPVRNLTILRLESTGRATTHGGMRLEGIFGRWRAPAPVPQRAAASAAFVFHRWLHFPLVVVDHGPSKACEVEMPAARLSCIMRASHRPGPPPQLGLPGRRISLGSSSGDGPEIILKTERERRSQQESHRLKVGWRATWIVVVLQSNSEPNDRLLRAGGSEWQLGRRKSGNEADPVTRRKCPAIVLDLAWILIVNERVMLTLFLRHLAFGSGGGRIVCRKVFSSRTTPLLQGA
jgi:hypothetical protein